MHEIATMAQGSLDSKRTELLSRREQLIHQLSQAARSNGDRKVRTVCKQILLTNEFIETLDRLSEEAKAKREPAVPRFVVSSYFLHETFKKLTADSKEQFSFITGVVVDGTFVLNQFIELVHEKRTMLGVTADARFTHKLLITLERFRHRLLAHFHSHPGDGADATKPSGIDTGFQERLERAGHVAVAAIFSRDGYVRFFRLDGNFDIEVYGEGVERHEPNIFRLTGLD